jgi:phosphoribosylaminoimidazolecarboxamide formyltransferase / IMP cyclohydrolase
LRRQLAGEAFAHTAAYDRTIADYFAGAELNAEELPATIGLELSKSADLRYGENPHQAAAVYKIAGNKSAGLLQARQLNGKELSYNNLLDLDSALGIVRSFPEPAAVVVKHNNPCGAATADELVAAARKALEGDPQSAFGGILAFNRTVDEPTAELLSTPGLFIEAIVAPDFAAGAVGILTTKPKWRANVRLLQVGLLDTPQSMRNLRFIEGGVLVQQSDVLPDPEAEWQVVTEKQPTPAMMTDLRFAWNMVRHVKSNAIVVCHNCMLLGAGAGQMSRVDSVDIAIRKAGERVKPAVMASDAFFPFPDSIHKAAAAGIAALIQPGGSVKDVEVIAACNEHNLPMIFTQRRHFKH